MSGRLQPRRASIKGAPGVLYRHVAALLRTRLLAGELVAGDHLPSIAELARTYQVAIVTVRHALALLEEEGLVKRVQGVGTLVTENGNQSRWLQLESSWGSLIALWGKSKPRPIRVLDRIGMPILDDGEGTPAPAYRYMKRVHVGGGVPYALTDIYVDRRAYALCPQRFDTEMVIVVLDSMNLVKRMRQRLTIGTADLEVASLLDIPVNSPVGVVRRVITDQAGVAVYVGEAVYRGDLVRLEREIKRP